MAMTAATRTAATTHGTIVAADGVTLVTAPNSPASALDGPPVFVRLGNLTPDFYAVNTMMPPYPPSGNADAGQQSVDLTSATTLVPQTADDDRRSADQGRRRWAYYAGAWDFALSHPPFAAGHPRQARTSSIIISHSIILPR